MVGVAVGTFLLAYYLSFGNVFRCSSEDMEVTTLEDFPSYLDMVLTRASFSFSFSTAADRSAPDATELGAWGYLYGLVQILAFSCGGIAVCKSLAGLPFCERCGLYRKRAKRTRRFTDDPDALRGLIETVSPFLAARRIADVEAAVESFGRPGPEKGGRLRVESSLWCCKACESRMLRVSAARRSEEGWRDIDGLPVDAVSESP